MSLESSERRVLVVEDEWLIAEFYGDVLRSEGYEVVGPAYNIAEAQELIRQNHLGAAILDVTLGTETSFPLAHMLAEKGVPFIFVSGRSDDEILSDFQNVPVILKPLNGDELPGAIKNLMSLRV
jgi:DNA-binding response OmpR family regulator